MHPFRFALLAPCLLATAALAERDVRVVATGVVEYNQFVSGTFAGVPVNAPVTMTIDLDPSDFLNSPNLPGRTRGYRFGPANFSLQIGSVTTTLRSTVTTAYWCLRNNDPRVDGFFISLGTDIDVPIPLAMTPNNYGIAFSRTFGNIPPPPSTAPDPTLQSLDLLGALGSWSAGNLSAYNFGIQLGEFSVPLGIGYQTLTISRLCAADFNSDGEVNPDDLADYINCYFTIPPCDRADINSDSEVNADDLADFINLYFAACA